MRGAGVLCVLLLMSAASASAAVAQQAMVLPSGQKIVFDKISVMNPLVGGGKKTVRASLHVTGDTKRTPEQLSVIADEFFLHYFGPYAEKKGFKLAAISMAKGLKAGPITFSVSDDFDYERQENGVWQPKHDSKLDDRPLPEPVPLVLPSGARISIEFEGLSYLQPARQKGWVSAYWSEISFETNPEVVYAQSREYWNSIKARIDPAVGAAGIFAYDKPRLGFYHFREHLYVIIRTNEKGVWTDLPASLEEVLGDRSRPVEASFGPVGLETVWPER